MNRIQFEQAIADLEQNEGLEDESYFLEVNLIDGTKLIGAWSFVGNADCLKIHDAGIVHAVYLSLASVVHFCVSH